MRSTHTSPVTIAARLIPLLCVALVLVASSLAVAQAADTDGDGIADSSDRCVDAVGLPDLAGCPDADFDSVADIDDECPTTAGSNEFGGCLRPNVEYMLLGLAVVAVIMGTLVASIVTRFRAAAKELHRLDAEDER